MKKKYYKYNVCETFLEKLFPLTVFPTEYDNRNIKSLKAIPNNIIKCP